MYAMSKFKVSKSNGSSQCSSLEKQVNYKLLYKRQGLYV